MKRIIITGRNDAVSSRPFSNSMHLVSGSQPASAACRKHAWPGGVIPCSPPGHHIKGASTPAEKLRDHVTPKAAGRPPDKPAADWSELFVLFAAGVAFVVGFAIVGGFSG